MLESKNALEASNGDIDGAIDYLRKKGLKQAAKKADRATHEGAVAISGRGIVGVACETDFVGRNEQFIAFVTALAAKADTEGAGSVAPYFESVKGDKVLEMGENMQLISAARLEGGSTVAGYVHTNGKVAALVALSGGTQEHARDLAMHVVAMNPLVANPEDVSAELIAKEKEIWAEQLKNEGKPEHIIAGILQGKEQKFAAEQALSCQKFVKDPSLTVQEYLGDAALVSFIRVAV